ncbi:MAG: MYXO-CTERM sorting domain-containing protein, partial [Myxococcota bacterium]
GCSTSDAGSSGALLVLLVLGLRRRRLRHGVATSMLALMLACSGDSDPTGEPPTGEPPTTEPPTTEPPATETPRHPTDPDESLSHAVSQLQLPGSRDEFGWDLDGDGSVDAAMGELVELTSSLGITLDDYLRGAIEGGRLQVLLDSTVKDGEVLVLGYQGVDGERIEDVVDNFYRHGDAPIGVLVGSIDEERNVEARGEGSFEFRMRLTDLDGLEIVLPVDAARFEGQVGGFLVEGTLGGAVPVASLAEGVFEPLASYINTLIAADDGCPENCDRRSLGLALILIDGDGDGSVSADELAGYEPLQERLAPDIDLDEDGTPDAISIALRVSAVRANLFQ